MGLLDTFLGDADQTRAIGLLGAGMMNGGFQRGAPLAMQFMAEAPQRRRQGLLDQMKMEEAQMRLAEMRRESELQTQLQQAARESVISPQRATSLSMGPMPDGSTPPTVRPGFDQKGFLQRLYGINPLKALEIERSLQKENRPITVAPGASLVDPDSMKPMFTAPKEQSLPSAIQEYQFAVSQGYRGSFNDWDKERKRAGANSVNLSVNTEKNLLGGVAEGVSKGISDARGAAQASLGTINTVSRLMDSLDSGQVMAGPGTTFRQFGLQLGSMLGIAGQNAQEKLIGTRQAIQSLAQLELDAAQQMKGQGQITEAERAIIRRAASGDIDSMTVPELRVLGNALDRTARLKIQNYRSQVKPLLSNPNAAPIAPFLSIDEPPQRQAPSIIRRYNPATGRIE